MQYLKLLFVIFVLSVSTSLVAQQTFPSISIKTLDGKSVDIQDYAKNGKVTYLTFWATWCLPCQKELDILSELYPEWQEAYDMEIVAITIDTRRALAKVGPLVESKGWEFTILSDTNKTCMNTLGFQTVPQAFLLDKNGNIAYSHTGFVPGDEVEMEDRIAELVK